MMIICFSMMMMAMMFNMINKRLGSATESRVGINQESPTAASNPSLLPHCNALHCNSAIVQYCNTCFKKSASNCNTEILQYCNTAVYNTEYCNNAAFNRSLLPHCTVILQNCIILHYIALHYITLRLHLTEEELGGLEESAGRVFAAATARSSRLSGSGLALVLTNAPMQCNTTSQCIIVQIQIQIQVGQDLHQCTPMQCISMHYISQHGFDTLHYILMHCGEILLITMFWCSPMHRRSMHYISLHFDTKHCY